MVENTFHKLTSKERMEDLAGEEFSFTTAPVLMATVRVYMNSGRPASRCGHLSRNGGSGNTDGKI